MLRSRQARHYANGLRRNKAALTLSKSYRSSHARRNFLSLTTGVRKAQFRWRKLLSRRSRCAVKVQASWRRWHAEGVFWGVTKCVTTLQNHWRSIRAVRMRRQLKAEGRDVNKLAEEKEHLQQEMLALKSMLKVQKKEREKTQQLKETSEETEKLRRKCEQVIIAKRDP